MYKHKLRKKVFEQGQWRTKIVHTNDELGSGWFDKNDKEVFEGDVIRHNSGTLFPVKFRDGALFIDLDNENTIPLIECDRNKFEVVGHADD